MPALRKHHGSRTRRQVLALGAGAAWAAVALIVLGAGAQSGKPLRIVVPFTPGGSTDILAPAAATGRR